MGWRRGYLGAESSQAGSVLESQQIKPLGHLFDKRMSAISAGSKGGRKVGSSRLCQGYGVPGKADGIRLRGYGVTGGGEAEANAVSCTASNVCWDRSSARWNDPSVRMNDPSVRWNGLWSASERSQRAHE